MGGSYINGGVMDDPKTSIDLDQDQSNRAIFQGGAKYWEQGLDNELLLQFINTIENIKTSSKPSKMRFESRKNFNT